VEQLYKVMVMVMTWDISYSTAITILQTKLCCNYYYFTYLCINALHCPALKVLYNYCIESIVGVNYSARSKVGPCSVLFEIKLFIHLSSTFPCKPIYVPSVECELSQMPFENLGISF